MTLGPSQVRAVLEGLPGWELEDKALVRGVPVTPDSRDALIEAVSNAAKGQPAVPEVHIQPDLVVLRVGDPSGKGVTPADVELAARIDRVLIGSVRDEGSTH